MAIETTATTKTTSATKGTTHPAHVVEFRAQDNDGNDCIAINIDAELNITYPVSFVSALYHSVS